MAAQGHLGATVHHVEKNHQAFLLVHVDYGGDQAIERTIDNLDGLASLVGRKGPNDDTPGRVTAGGATSGSRR
jgi:hypothetical protein